MNGEKVRAAIRISDMTMEEAADVMGISRPTLMTRLEYPEDFRLRELRKLHAALNDMGKAILDGELSGPFEKAN